MAKQNNTKQNKKQVQLNHAFKNCRETLLNPSNTSGASNSTYIVTTDGTGACRFSQLLCPIGLTGATVTTSGTFVTGSPGNISSPSLRGLFNRALQFQWYRVTRARFIFVGAVGSTVTGLITLAGYTDVNDVATQTSTVNISGPNTKTFDLANSATKDISVPILVDSAWKRVSHVTTMPGNSYPFVGANATSLSIINTIGDLSFGAISLNLSNGPANSSVGAIQIEYDVEFKGVIDSGING